MPLSYAKQQYAHTKASERNPVLRERAESKHKSKGQQDLVHLFIHHHIRSLWVSNNRNLTQASLSQEKRLIVKDREHLRIQEQTCSWVSSGHGDWKAVGNCGCSATCLCFSLCVCLFLFWGRIEFSAAIPCGRCKMTSPGSQDSMSHFQLHEERERWIQPF